MKKIYLLISLAIAAFAFVALAETTRTTLVSWPTTVTSAPAEEVTPDAWTQKSVTGLKWTVFQDTQFRVMGNSFSLIDNWLTSPQFDVVAGNEYEISCSYKATATTTYSLEAYFGATSPLENLSAVEASTSKQEMPKNYSTSFAPATVTFTAETTGKMYFALHVTNLNSVFVIKDITITEIAHEQPAPAGIRLAAEYTGEPNMLAFGSLSATETKLTIDKANSKATFFIKGMGTTLLNATVDYTLDGNVLTLVNVPTVKMENYVLVEDPSDVIYNVSEDGTTLTGTQTITVGAMGMTFDVDLTSATLVGEVSGEDPIEPDPIEPGEHECVGLQAPYKGTPALAAGSMQEGWEVIDANGDDKKWKAISETGAPSGTNAVMQITYSASGVNQDDYLISPKIHFEAGKKYIISYNWRTHSASYPENLTVYLSPSNEPATIKASKVLKDHESVKGPTTYTLEQILFTPEETGDYQVAFYCHSLGNQYHVYVATLDVIELVFSPNPVSELTATPDPEKSVSCKLTWVLPTNDTYGYPLEEDKVVTAVKVWRDEDETPIATLDGPATEFTDTEAIGLTAGKHSYAVSAVFGDVETEKATVKSSFIGFKDPSLHVCEGAQIPFSSKPAVTTSSMNEEWGVINANNDDKYWSAANESGVACAKITYSRTADADDYLVSPKIHMESGEKYVVSYTMKTGSSKEKLTVYLSESNEPADIKESDVLADYDEFSSTTFTKYAHMVTGPDTEDYFVVFYNHSIKDRYYVFVADLDVEKYEFAPGAPTNLVATEGENRALTCKLTWTLPTKDKYGMALPADKTISAVKIYRDGAEEAIATLEGDATSFTDSEEYGLTSGKHTYAVSVVCDDIEGAQIAVGPTKYVGPYAPAALPATFDFVTSEDYGMWTKVKGENANEDVSWQYNSSSTVPAAMFAGRLNSATDDYLITPPFKVEEAGYYRVDYGAFNSNSGYPTIFNVLLTNKADMAGEDCENTMLKEGWVLPAGTTTTTPIPSTVIDFYVETPGTYYLAAHHNTPAFNATAPNYQTYTIYFRNAKISKSQFVPGVVTDLKAVPAADCTNNINVSWTAPTKDFAGLDMEASKYKTEIYLNEDETPAMTVDGGVESAVVPVAEPGLYTVTVKTVSNDEEAATAPTLVSANTTWVGSRLVELPYTTSFAATDPVTSIWEAVDANNDGKTFGYRNYMAGCYWELENTRYQNDYLVSPYFNLAPGYYKVSITHKGGTTATQPEPILGLFKAGQFTLVDETPVLSQSVTIEMPTQYLLTYDWVFKVEEAGDYQIVYGLKGDMGYGSASNIYQQLRTFSIEATEGYPANVSDLTYTVSGANDEIVTLNWTNPATIYLSESPLESIESIVVLRDNELLATLTTGLTPGAEASYTDELVPAGKHTYTVYATADGVAHGNDYASVETKWVGGALDAGLDGGIHHDSDFPGWETDNSDNYGPTTSLSMYAWHFWSNKNPAYWEIEGSSHDQNDYLVSPPVKVNANTIYKIVFSARPSANGASSTFDAKVKMGSEESHKDFKQIGGITIGYSQDKYTWKDYEMYVMVGEEAAPSAIRAKVEEMEHEPTEAERQEYVQYLLDSISNIAARVDAAGNHRIAIHVEGKGSMALKAFHMTEFAKDGIPTGIDNVFAKDGILFDGKGLIFDGEAKIEVYNLTGALVATETAEGSYSLEDLGNGYYIVKVTTADGPTTLKVALK